MHAALRCLGDIKIADEAAMEQSVDWLIAEAFADQSQLEWDEGRAAARAEALAILSHEFRRRAALQGKT